MEGRRRSATFVPVYSRYLTTRKVSLSRESTCATHTHDTRQMELELVKWNVQTKLYSRGLFLVDFLAGLDDFVSILSFIVWLNVYFARFQWNKQKFISYVKRLIPFYSKHFATSPLFGWWTFTAYIAHTRVTITFIMCHRRCSIRTACVLTYLFMFGEKVHYLESNAWNVIKSKTFHQI